MRDGGGSGGTGGVTECDDSDAASDAADSRGAGRAARVFRGTHSTKGGECCCCCCAVCAVCARGAAVCRVWCRVVVCGVRERAQRAGGTRDTRVRARTLACLRRRRRRRAVVGCQAALWRRGRGATARARATPHSWLLAPGSDLTPPTSHLLSDMTHHKTMTGRMHFVKFETARIQDCLDFITAKVAPVFCVPLHVM
jgi:hypothetical protein